MDNNKQYIREGQKVTFSAQLEKGDRRLTSWIVYEGNQCDDNHIVKEEKQVGTEFSHIFEKAGEYTIVSYGKRDEINESTAIRAQVEEEFIFEGIECLSPTSICYKEEGVWKVKRKIESREEREERIKNKKREPKEGDVGFQVKFKDNKIPTKLEFRIKFKGEAAQIIKKGNAIWYTPVYPNKKGEKFDIIVKFSNTEIIEPMVVLTELPPFENVVDHKNVGVTQITTIPEGIQELRPKDSLKLNFNPKLCFIAGEPEINPSNLVWKLNGNTLLAKGTQIEIPREIIANNKGENKVEVFKNNASTKSIASYNFSVVKNEIIKFEVSETPKFGKEVTFEVKEMTFSKLEANEEVYWEVRQGCNLVPPVAGFTFKHLFNKEGVFKVRCYISDVVVEKEYNIIQPKILANTAKWIDKDGASGNILNTAGYDQEVYVYVEHLGLGGEEVVVEVYNAKDKNTPIFTSKKITVPLDSKNFTFLYPIKKTYKGKTAEEKKKEDKESKDFQIFFKIKSIGTCVSPNDFEKNLLTITNRGDIVNAYFCDADDTKIYRAIEVGTVKDLHFKLYMTNMLKREVEILFYIFKPFPTTIPAKDCLNWVHWEKIASHFSKKQPFHTTKAIVNNKGEILVKVPTSKLMQIGDFTSVVAVFKIMGSDGKVKGAYLERRNTLMLFSNKALTHMKENFAPVKVLLEKVNNKVLRQEIGKESVDENTIYITRKWEKRITSYKKEDDNHAYSATYGTFVFGDIIGFICEPYGPETTESEQDQRIPIGTYNLEWHPKSGKFPKNVYTKEGRYVKKQGYSPNYINFPELNKGIIRIYNKDVPKGRGILLHAGFYGIWTEGCINPFRTLSEKIRDLNIELKESVELLFEIYDKIDKIGIEKVKIVIVDEINKPKSKEDEKYGEIIKKRYR